LSTKQKVYKVKSGDIFTLPLGDGRVALGQVVGKYKRSALYVIIFDTGAPEDAVQSLDLSEVTGTQPLLARMTFDARFRPGMWQIVGNRTPNQRGLLPAFSFGSDDYDGVQVTNFDGTRMRPARGNEATDVPRLVIDAPIALEKAARAHYGLEPRLPVYDDLRYRNTPTSMELFGE